jgi:DNA replication regulator SLD2
MTLRKQNLNLNLNASGWNSKDGKLNGQGAMLAKSPAAMTSKPIRILVRELPHHRSVWGLIFFPSAQKYKQYNRLRDIISAKIPPPPKDDASSKKRKAKTSTAETPSKRMKHEQTPSKNHTLSAEVTASLMATPTISRKLFSPVLVTSIGPTPHRDGRVLGLFDLMVEKELGTPSKSIEVAGSTANPRVQATPSKHAGDSSSDVKLRRTPMSTSKRQLLDSFLTPLKKTDGNFRAGKAPMSVSRLQFNTPAFLKRNPLPPVDENKEFTSPQPVRLPRKPLARGLSAIVASLRQVEEEAMDDDLEAMREMEYGGDSAPSPPRAVPKPPLKEEAQVLVPDSQAQQLPLGGFDDEGLYDSPVEEQKLYRGQPLKVYKKKGQKRTTRRVNMKPVRVARPSGDNDDSQVNEDGGVVPETQLDGDEPDVEPEDLGSDSGFEDLHAGGDGDEKDEKRRKKKKKKKERKSDQTKKDGPVKRVVKKVNAMAHANFRKLKLKNNGAKGGPGFNSRFRRRR